MEKKKVQVNNKKRLIIAIIVVVVVIAAIVLLTQVVGKNENDTTNNNNTANNSSVTENARDEFKMIRIDQTLDKDGRVKNLDGVRWHNAMIRQNDNEMEISIDLNNDEDVAIEAKTLEVAILDKNNKVLFTKEVQMEAMTADTRYTTIDLEFEIDDYLVVYDIQITAK